MLFALTLLVAPQPPLMAPKLELPPPGRVIPPPGIAVSDADKTELAAGLTTLAAKLDRLKKHPLYADVAVLHKAVQWALADNNFYSPREVQAAKELLAEGQSRADALALGQAPWTKQTGLVLRGYISKLDGSVQPLGLVVPDNAFDGQSHRLDLFLHGRGENLTELSFLDQRRKSPGEFTPPGALVLHPYGRFCNANHLAGEVDVFEGIDFVKKHYQIDADRVVVRGFSMGGGSTWHLAVHHADYWAAAAPGAGFSETPRFIHMSLPQPDYILKLMKLYDATDWAVNIAQVPLIVYSGEVDGQRQAAVVMEEALKEEGLPMTHIIGPGAGHFYHKDSKPLINAAIDKAIANGREKNPQKIRFTTWSLRYPKQNWLTVTGMEHHWERARVEAERNADGSEVTLKTSGVTALTLALKPRRVVIDGQKLPGGQAFYKDTNGRVAGGAWKAGQPKGTRKKPGLQGPIDDAFMERFVFVRPTGTPLSAQKDFTERALKTAQQDWHTFFRGDAVTVDDTKLTDEQLKNANIVLFGDPSSNVVLRRIASKLPVRWTADGFTLNGKTYSNAAPVLIYPNPLNPSKYVVINSGYTWHDYNAGNNSLHTPKLPDWAALPLAGGTPLDAGFFNESWK